MLKELRALNSIIYFAQHYNLSRECTKCKIIFKIQKLTFKDEPSNHVKTVNRRSLKNGTLYKRNDVVVLVKLEGLIFQNFLGYFIMWPYQF